jgi:hypothetical protein
MPTTTTNHATEAAANAARSATNNAADAAVKAARVATTSVNSYMDTYVQSMNRIVDAAQRAYVAWLETGFRVQTHGLNVLRYAVDETTRTEAGQTARPNTAFNNVARYAYDETVELQKDARRLVDEVANTLKVGQEATIELTQAQFRLVQNGLNYRNGGGA